MGSEMCIRDSLGRTIDKNPIAPLQVSSVDKRGRMTAGAEHYFSFDSKRSKRLINEKGLITGN